MSVSSKRFRSFLKKENDRRSSISKEKSLCGLSSQSTVTNRGWPWARFLWNPHTSLCRSKAAARNKYAQAHDLWDLPGSRVRASATWAAGCVPTVCAGTFYWGPNCTLKKETPSGSDDLTPHHQTQPPLLGCWHVFFLLSSSGSFSEILAVDSSKGREGGSCSIHWPLQVLSLRIHQSGVAFSFLFT